MRLDDLTGRTFNNWTVLNRVSSDRNGMSLYLCRCRCGTEKQVYGKHLKSGASKGCRRCEPRMENKANWKGHGEISGTYWADIQSAANGEKKGRRRPVPFELTIEFAWELYLKQNRLCALSGVPIHFDYSTRRTASLDRVDSSLGYVPDNVQWVHKDVNRMKNTFDQDYFVEMCRRISGCPIK